MRQMISRRGPNTFLIYGISAAVIALWWGGLWALGMDGESGGIVLLSVVAALVLAVAMMRDPFGMLCLIIFALPFSQGILQVEIGIVTMNPYTAGITIACLVAVCGIGLGVVHYRYAPEDVLILLLGASYLLSTLLAEDVLEAGFLAFHGVFIPIVTYFALKSFVRTQEQYRKVLVSFVAGTTTFAVYGLFNFVQNPERLHVLNMPPISAAAVMTAALIIVLYSEWWRRKIGLLAAVALLAGLVATFSRGYLLLLLLTPVFFAILRRGHATKLMVAMLVGSLVGTLLFVTSYEVFFVKLMNKEQEQSLARITDLQFWMLSLYNRARYYAVGLEEFAKSPLIGNGFHQNFASAEGRAVVWHNFHVEWLEYGGISAYLLYMSLLIVHFRSMSRASHAFRAAAVNLTVVFTILVNGLTNSFTAGVSPVLGFVFMALNRAYLSSVSWNRLAR